ncbi:MAG: alanine--glyoxylate aminotransferase family protein [Phycisphaerae bacterium]|nr:alanine--glyoxylate aminotransferase family protein [Phycisphaerae bacterium]
MPAVKHLMTPGPTPVPPQVLEALSLPILHHRTSEFRNIAKGMNADLAYVFGAIEPPQTIVGSGTAAMEAAIVTLLGHFRDIGHKALVFSNGKFAERWVKVCSAFGIGAEPLKVDYGQPISPEQVEAKLKTDPKLRAIVMVHSETSTATVCDLQGIAAICRKHDALLLVDGITSVGALPVDADAWGIDALVTGSQKALMNPPGLGFAAISARGWDAANKLGKTPCCLYLDLRAYRDKTKDNDSPYTAAVNLVQGVAVAAKMIRQKGRENVWADVRKQAVACRAAAGALGLKVFSSRPADSVTALVYPPGVDDKKFRKETVEKHSVQLAGGQGSMEGAMFRVSHMGAVTMDDLNASLVAIADALNSQGHKCSADEALKAAESAAK